MKRLFAIASGGTERRIIDIVCYLVPLGRRTTVSKYEALAAHLRHQIRSGQLKPGDRLPSIAQLREQFNTSAGTVRYSILTLKAEKLVEGRQGSGVFVAALT